MSNEELKKQILEFVKRRRYVSFAEIEWKFGRGDMMLYDPEMNIILWGGLKPEVCEAIIELLREEKLYVKPCTPFVYYADGKVLGLPIARRLKRYKRPHWLPVVLDIKP